MAQCVFMYFLYTKCHNSVFYKSIAKKLSQYENS